MGVKIVSSYGENQDLFRYISNLFCLPCFLHVGVTGDYAKIIQPNRNLRSPHTAPMQTNGRMPLADSSVSCRTQSAVSKHWNTSPRLLLTTQQCAHSTRRSEHGVALVLSQYSKTWIHGMTVNTPNRHVLNHIRLSPTILDSWRVEIRSKKNINVIISLSLITDHFNYIFL